MRSSYQCSIDFEEIDEASKLSFPVEVEHQFDEEEYFWLADLMIWEYLLVDVEKISPKMMKVASKVASYGSIL